ncbi:MAG: NAD-dependent epimerase/dehydratase family protein [Candidatus Eremiobacteraeota bacterium]|nr:NAD-dependent epimerase/dehydratase family protein [Candidatus Eremiobacteraeota bacterium]
MPTIEGKSVVVTGGAGFIGSHLVDAIVARKPARIAAIDNFFLGNRDNLSEALAKFPALEVVDMDATDLSDLRAFLQARDVDVVFDLATIPLPASLERPLWSSKVICDLALVVCDLCREGVFKTLIHCSSSEAYGSAQYVPMDEEHPLKTETPYAAAKAAASLLVESYMRTFSIDMAIGRPFNNYGPRQNGRDFSGIVPRLIQRIMRGETPVIFGDGKQTRDYLYVTDTARGLIALYETGSARGETINIASGKETSVLDIVSDVSRLMDWHEAPRFDPPRIGDVRRHLAATSKAEKVLGFEPIIAWNHGIRETVSWYREHPDRLI